MKMKNILLALISVVSLSCSKENCKEKQANDLKAELEQFQKEVSRSNLSSAQIIELTKRHDERNKQILAECN